MASITIDRLEQVPAAINQLFEEINNLKAHLSPVAPQPTTTDDGGEVYLTRKEVAAALKISLPTLGELTKAGKVKGYRVGGTNSVRYKQSELPNALTSIRPSSLNPDPGY